MFESVVFTKNDIEICTHLLIHDKKNVNGVVQFTLLSDIGKGVINEVVESELINEAFNDYLYN